MPLTVWGAVNNLMRSCKSPGKPVRQVREPSEGFELRCSFYMQETVNRRSKLTFSRERWSGIAPVNIKNVGDRHNTIRQTDFGFGVDARESPGGPLRPDLAFAFCQAPFLMIFATGGIPHAGSWQNRVTFLTSKGAVSYKKEPISSKV